MVTLLIESISTSLLIGSSLLLYFWKEQSKTATHLIKTIGICVGLISLYKITNIIFSLTSIQAYSTVTKVFSLGGFLVLMFSLLNYLEDKK